MVTVRRDHRLHILQHALGLDDYGMTRAGERCPDETYRNFYAADDNDDLLALVEAGLMVRHAPRDGGVCDYPVFVVTAAGRAHVREHSPRPPRRTRSQRRYAAFLDADTGLSFGEWLKLKWGGRG